MSKVAATVETVLVRISHLLILTTPSFLMLKYGFLTESRLEAKNAKGGYLFKLQLFSTIPRFFPRKQVLAVEVILYYHFQAMSKNAGFCSVQNYMFFWRW